MVSRAALSQLKGEKRFSPFSIHRSVVQLRKMASEVSWPPHFIARNGVDYKNLLLDIKAQNDLLYCCAAKAFPAYKHCKPRKPADIKCEVLASPPVRQILREMIDKKIWSPDRAEKEASSILDNMAHLFDMKALRSLAYPTKKVLQKIYSGVYVNESAISSIRSLCQNNPVIFVPSHRSYMDFVLMQMVCFHYEIPVPAIASAQDFLQMNFLAEWMRRCGAFFIRRSFADDPLYRTIFNTYVQTQIVNGDRTMEAFVEGGRSRTGKSLHPKYGFLTAVVEPFLTNLVFDLYLIPVNISYEKIIEETLYANEVLGSSKPRETTSALFKARRILGTDYGNAFISFSDPISVRQFFEQPNAPWRIDRSVHMIPSAVFVPTPDEVIAIKALAHRIVKRQESIAVLGLWPLICTALCRLAAYSKDDILVVHMSKLKEDVTRLIDLARRLGHPIHCAAQLELQDSIVNEAKLHDNVLQYDPSLHTFSLKPCESTSALPSTHLLASTLGGSVGFLVSQIIFAHYSNQCAHFFAPLSYLAANFGANALRGGTAVSLDVLREKFNFLQRLLAREFVVDLLSEKYNFDAALELGTTSGIFCVDDKTVGANRPSDIRDLKFVLEPIMIVYYVCIDFLLLLKDNQVMERDYVNKVQEGLVNKLKSGSSDGSSAPRWFRTVSTETIKNCLHGLLDMGVVQKIKAPSTFQHPYFAVPESSKLNDIKISLNSFMGNFYDAEEWPDENVTHSVEEEIEEEKRKLALRRFDDIRIRSKL